MDDHGEGEYKSLVVEVTRQTVVVIFRIIRERRISLKGLCRGERS